MLKKAVFSEKTGTLIFGENLTKSGIAFLVRYLAADPHFSFRAENLPKLVKTWADGSSSLRTQIKEAFSHAKAHQVIYEKSLKAEAKKKADLEKASTKAGKLAAAEAKKLAKKEEANKKAAEKATAKQGKQVRKPIKTPKPSKVAKSPKSKIKSTEAISPSTLPCA